MGKLRLQGYLEVPPERREQVRAALPLHMELTHAEPGCTAFEVTERPSRPGHFLVTECFVDRAAFEAHQDRARDTAWAQVTAGLPRHYTITEED